MKITEVEAIPLRMPLAHPYEIAIGTRLEAYIVVVVVRTDQGVVGYGDTSSVDGIPIAAETQRSIVSIVRDHLGPLLIGENPIAVPRLIDKMNGSIYGNNYAKAAIDSALYDCAGQALGLPVYMLLGGRRRDQVLLSAGVGARDPATAVKTAEEALADGYRSLKVKVGFGRKRDIENLTAIRALAGPDIPIRIDANMGWSFVTAVQTIRRMEACDLQLVEQPLKRHDYNGMAALAAAVDVPIAADEMVWSPEDAQNLVRFKAAEMVNMKVMKLGGLCQAMRATHILDSADLHYWVGTMGETGIGVAANIHFSAAVKSLPVANEGARPAPYFLGDDLIRTPFVTRDGCVGVDQVARPGLGIEVDQVQIQRYRID
jgi:L-alanine-DL-glutamate epimerase-like enolase superfamily enzyme